jgi:methylated-DNA-protein-cysteine methyltransferase related protein
MGLLSLVAQLGDKNFAEEVYRLTKLIPRGQVATYGQIATYIYSPRAARAVGTALRNLPRKRSKEVPWHRVINAAGKISHRGDVERPVTQQRLLEKEGVVFDKAGRTNLVLFGWAGPKALAAARRGRAKKRIQRHP